MQAFDFLFTCPMQSTQKAGAFVNNEFDDVYLVRIVGKLPNRAREPMWTANFLYLFASSAACNARTCLYVLVTLVLRQSEHGGHVCVQVTVKEEIPEDAFVLDEAEVDAVRYIAVAELEKMYRALDASLVPADLDGPVRSPDQIGHECFGCTVVYVLICIECVLMLSLCLRTRACCGARCSARDESVNRYCRRGSACCARPGQRGG